MQRVATDFNPRSREGSDCAIALNGEGWIYFNPRSREGSDSLQGQGQGDDNQFQSTLPRRERPYNDIQIYILCAYFNPRSREGSDLPSSAQTWYPLPYFNPRSREGSDITSTYRGSYSIISIHAPAKGATRISSTNSPKELFQSTLPRRERLHLLTSFRLQYGYFYFISPIKYSSCFKKIN